MNDRIPDVPGTFGGTRRMHVSDVDDSWLIVVVRPDLTRPEPTARHIDTYKVAASALPEDPELLPKIAADLRDLADELERRGWNEAFRSPRTPVTADLGPTVGGLEQ